MDLSNLQINVDTVVDALSNRIATLEREKAVLLAQQEALIKQIEGSVEESS